MTIPDITRLGWVYGSTQEGFLKFEGFVKKGTRHELGFLLMHRIDNKWTLISEKDPAGIHLTRFAGKIDNQDDLRILHKFLEI